MRKRILTLAAALLLPLSACGKNESEEHVLWQNVGTAALSSTSQTGQTAQTAPTDSEPAELRDDGREYAILPMEYLSITQTCGEGTHLCNYAVDFAGVDTGIDEFYAPFTLRIVRIQEGYNIVWAQSVEKVHLANGGLDYVTVLLEHSNNIDDLYVGQVIAQGEVFYTEGTAGNAVGNHVHCEFGLGEYVDEGCYHAEDGRVAANNGIAPNEIVFLTQSTKYVKDGDGGMQWQTLPATTEQIVSHGWHCQGAGHCAGEITVTAEAACATDGSLEYICTQCGQKITECLPAAGHTAVLVREIPAEEGGCGVAFYECQGCGAAWPELTWSAAPACGFSDVAADDPAAQSIAAVCQQGWMAGVSETEFSPDSFVSRAELLQIFFDWSGGGQGYSCDYTDVEKDDEEYNLVGWATATGLAAATSEKKFTPEVAVTREDAIAMVLGYWKLTGQSSSIADASGVQAWAVSSGLYETTDNLHCVMTRAEAARLLVLARYLPAVG